MAAKQELLQGNYNKPLSALVTYEELKKMCGQDLTERKKDPKGNVVLKMQID